MKAKKTGSLGKVSTGSGRNMETEATAAARRKYEGRAKERPRSRSLRMSRRHQGRHLVRIRADHLQRAKRRRAPSRPTGTQISYLLNRMLRHPTSTLQIPRMIQSLRRDLRTSKTRPRRDQRRPISSHRYRLLPANLFRPRSNPSQLLQEAR